MGEYLYILKGNSLVRANASTWQIDRQLTREDGLSGSQILDICYSHDLDRLVVVYTDGIIDVMQPDGSIWTIPDFSNAPMAGTDKTILSIREQQGLLFLHTNYGFAIADLERLVMLHNISLGTRVSCAWIYSDHFFYSSESGTFFCPRYNSNPYLADSWKPTNTSYHITRALILDSAGKQQCWLMRAGGKLCRIYPGEIKMYETYTGGTISDLQRAGQYVMANTADSLVLFDTRLGVPPMKEADCKPGQRIACRQTSPLIDGKAIGICALNDTCSSFGLLYADGGIYADSFANVSARSFEAIALHDAPLTISNHQQSSMINRVVTSPSGNVAMTYVPPLTTGYGKMLGIDGFLTTVTPDGQWDNLDKTCVTSYLTPGEGQMRFCAIDEMIADPFYPERYWFSTLEDGVVGIDHGKFLCRYDAPSTNGGLETCSPNCTRIGGMGFDAKGNFWCFCEGHNYGLRVLSRATDKWYKFRINGLEKEYGFTHLCVTRLNGRHQVWGCQHFKYQLTNVFCYDYGQDITSSDDDRYVVFKTIKPNHAGAVPFVPYYNRGIYEGPTGAIWLLNTSGLYIFDDPDAVFDQPGEVRQVLSDVEPTSLTIDSQNRVWVSTNGQGIYLFSADGREQLAQFTSANSILGSNDVQSVSYQPKSSQLWIVTDGQILSYAYDADEYDTSPTQFTTQAYCHPSQVQIGSSVTVNVFGLKDYSPAYVSNSQGRILQQDTALGGIINIHTANLPVGSYTINATDAEGNHGDLVTFSVVPSQQQP